MPTAVREKVFGIHFLMPESRGKLPRTAGNNVHRQFR
jgi:hypothetical protein